MAMTVRAWAAVRAPSFFYDNGALFDKNGLITVAVFDHDDGFLPAIALGGQPGRVAGPASDDDLGGGLTAAN
jgi:hypothetical protein